MASTGPPRRFAPEPVETTTKSSKDRDAGQQEEEKPKARRFAPEPVETSVKSSRDTRNAPETGDLTQPRPPRKFAPQPVETSTKSSKSKSSTTEEKPKPRRFAPEPVETTTKSSRDKSQDQEQKPKARRFAPEPVETSHTSSKKKKESEAPHIRFTAEPFSSSHSSNRASGKEDLALGDVAPDQEPGTRPVRRFAPILLDTAQRSRKAQHVKNLTFDDKTESGYHLAAREHRRHITGTKTPAGARTPFQESDSDMDTESNHHLDVSALEQSAKLRPMSPLDGGPRPLSSRFSERSHSFRLPDLDTIESSESEQASVHSSLSSSPGQGSPITTSDSSWGNEFKHATRIRESVDENFSHYLLQLEAKRAEQRMREAALAAFPNSDFHEPVQHYVNEETDTDSVDSLEDRPATWEGHDDEMIAKLTRRESTKVPWEQLEMQKHAEKMEQERSANRITHKQTTQGPWWTPGLTAAFQPADNEMKSMQDRARPPMLGNDIRFPRCRSPDPARFDVTQGSAALRNQMCYLTEHAEAESKKASQEPGLWQGMAKPNIQFTSIKTPASSTSSAVNKIQGLWGGFCLETGEQSSGGLAPPPPPTGLMTPRYDVSGNPFEQSFAVPHAAGTNEGPGLITPPSSQPRGLTPAGLGTIDAVLVSEKELDDVMARDYPDSFITQVYNYLSLGYPSLAKPFDAELSKISRYSIADLRQDDVKAKEQPRGYIRLGPDFEGGGGEGMKEDNCMRWQALKVYIREWARQEKDMVNADGSGGNWGATARRGSWGL